MSNSGDCDVVAFAACKSIINHCEVLNERVIVRVIMVIIYNMMRLGYECAHTKVAVSSYFIVCLPRWS